MEGYYTTVRQIYNEYVTVKDDGIGLPKEFNYKNTETLGFQIVDTLVNQIGGSLKIDSHRPGKRGSKTQKSGIEVSIEFKEPKHRVESRLPENIEGL